MLGFTRRTALVCIGSALALVPPSACLALEESEQKKKRLVRAAEIYKSLSVADKRKVLGAATIRQTTPEEVIVAIQNERRRARLEAKEKEAARKAGRPAPARSKLATAGSDLPNIPAIPDE